MTPAESSSSSARRAARRRPDDAGTITVELAIATPLVGLLLLAIAQFALWAHAVHIAQAAANTGVQTARAYRGDTAAATADTRTVLDQTAGTVLPERHITITRTAATATATIDGTAATVLPGITPAVHVTVTAPRETTGGTP
jgi:Flp pilus assembly protein TadG